MDYLSLIAKFSAPSLKFLQLTDLHNFVPLRSQIFCLCAHCDDRVRVAQRFRRLCFLLSIFFFTLSKKPLFSYPQPLEYHSLLLMKHTSLISPPFQPKPEQ